MSDLSEDDSSDSSSEFLVDPEKINLNLSFFSEKKSKSKPVANQNNTDGESTDTEDFNEVTPSDNIELFSQVLKNLETTQRLEDKEEDVGKKESVSDPVTTTKKKESRAQKTSSNEIKELLLQGETSTNSFQNDAEDGDEDEEDTPTPEEYTIPKDGVKITLPGTSFLMKKKKKGGGQDLKALLRRRLKANSILIEKVGLLCWLGYGFHLNRQINQPEVMATALSLISSNNYPKDRVDLKYLEKFTKFFKNVFKFETIESNGNSVIDKEELLKVLSEKKVSDYKVLVLLFIAALRGLGLNCRLIVSLGPPHRVLDDDPLFKSDTKSKSEKSGSNEKSNDTSKASKKGSTKSSAKSASDKSTVPENSPEAKKKAQLEAKKKAAEVLRLKSQNTTKKGKDNSTKGLRTKSNERESAKTESSHEEEKSVSNLRQLRTRKVANNKSGNSKQKSTEIAAKTDGTTSKYYEEDTDSEAEFVPKPKRIMKKKPGKEMETTENKNKKNNRKLLSSDSDNEDSTKQKKTQDIWAEVFLESEDCWICVNVMDEKVHCVTEIYKKAKKPVLYVVSWNADGLIKDVTRRYTPRWLTVTRKQRIDEKWWSECILPWKEKDSVISRAEDEMLLQKELEQPLPKTIGECKGHPLYVIARHLLKFEALYPPDCLPLGHTSTGEAIYSRHCVHTLCSRETWLKKARVVKPKEEAYKIVKARPKYDKLSGMRLKDSALEVFGEWQTMEYEPPVAKDGIVPRNEYGNVDLFKMCMLPKGTVHINLPALNRIARKLNIDCAPAVVGFNFGCMGAVPAIEGYVVCEEFEDTLREAWEAEQMEAIKREKEKREKRIYANWKRMIQGLLIRERLAAKYEFASEEKTTIGTKRTKHKKTDTKKPKVS